MKYDFETAVMTALHRKIKEAINDEFIEATIEKAIEEAVDEDNILEEAEDCIKTAVEGEISVNMEGCINDFLADYLA